MVEYKCPVCKSTAANCQDPGVCKTCLRAGHYHNPEIAGCNCCKICKKDKAENCGCCSLCRKEKDQCKCNNQAQANKIVRNPPDITNLLQQGKTFLPSYVSQMKRWGRMGGVNKADQGDVFLMMVSDKAPELYKEMEAHFGDDLVDEEQSNELITAWLKQRFGVDLQADLMRAFNALHTCVRKKQEDLISYCNRFDMAYTDLEKMGESLSATLKALMLLANAKLTDVDRQIVTSRLNFATEDVVVKAAIYKDMKNALKVHQQSKTGSNDPKEGAAGGEGRKILTLLNNILDPKGEDEEMSEEKLGDALCVFVEKYGLSKNGKSKDKIWKCWKCLCSCPKTRKCSCPCSNHKHWDCPKPNAAYYEKVKQRKSEEEEIQKTRRRSSSPEPGKSFISFSQSNNELCWVAKSVVSDVGEGEYKSINILKEALSTKSQQKVELSERSMKQVVVNRPVKKTDNVFVVIDTASPSTIVSLNVLQDILKSYPKAIRAALEMERSNKKFEFGGKERSDSLGRVKVPIYIKDTEDNLNLVWIQVEVLEIRDVPFLLGGRSLKAAGAEWDFENSRLKLKVNSLVVKKEFDIRQGSSGHFMLTFLPPSQHDADKFWSDHVKQNKWSDGAVKVLVNYVLQTDGVEVHDVIGEEIETLKVLVTKQGVQKEQLSMKEITKLHHFFGHAGKDKLKEFIQKAGRFGDKTESHLDQIQCCKVCQVEAGRKPKSKIAMANSSSTNLVGMSNIFGETALFPSSLKGNPDCGEADQQGVETISLPVSLQLSGREEVGYSQAAQLESLVDTTPVLPAGASGGEQGVGYSQATSMASLVDTGPVSPIRHLTVTSAQTEVPTLSQRPANSTVDLGTLVSGNFCHQLMSSKVVVNHCRSDHQANRGQARNVSTIQQSRQDLVINNANKLKPGVTLASENGQYLVVLEQTEGNSRVRGVSSKQETTLSTSRQSVLSGENFCCIPASDEEKASQLPPPTFQSVPYLPNFREIPPKN